MPYKYLEKTATADIAFNAWGSSPEEMFKACSDALLNVMVDNPHEIRNLEHKTIKESNDSLEMLLFDVLQELIYFKDSLQLLLYFDSVDIVKNGKSFTFLGDAWGEQINYSKHQLALDVKAVTFHQFRVDNNGGVWNAHIVLDI